MKGKFHFSCANFLSNPPEPIPKHSIPLALASATTLNVSSVLPLQLIATKANLPSTHLGRWSSLFVKSMSLLDFSAEMSHMRSPAIPEPPIPASTIPSTLSGSFGIEVKSFHERSASDGHESRSPFKSDGSRNEIIFDKWLRSFVRSKLFVFQLSSSTCYSHHFSKDSFRSFSFSSR